MVESGRWFVIFVAEFGDPRQVRALPMSRLMLARRRAARLRVARAGDRRLQSHARVDSERGMLDAPATVFPPLEDERARLSYNVFDSQIRAWPRGKSASRPNSR